MTFQRQRHRLRRVDLDKETTEYFANYVNVSECECVQKNVNLKLHALNLKEACHINSNLVRPVRRSSLLSVRFSAPLRGWHGYIIESISLTITNMSECEILIINSHNT